MLIKGAIFETVKIAECSELKTLIGLLRLGLCPQTLIVRPTL